MRRSRDVAFDDCRLGLSSFRLRQARVRPLSTAASPTSDFYEAAVKAAMFIGAARWPRRASPGSTFEDTEFRGCDLTAIGNPERLRGVRMPWADIVQSADVLAAGLGIEIAE